MKSGYYQKKKTYGIGHTRRRKIVGLVGQLDGKRILDVGCADGRLGSHLKTGNNFVAGVEISEEAVAVAKTVLDRVYVFDIEKEWSAEIKNEKFDVVILSEVVEHIFDPVDVIRRTREVIKDSGELIITTPNFVTWTNRLRFLFGSFAYQEEGMFDFGHIRWFTYAYLKEVVAESGFVIVAEDHILFPGSLAPLLKYWPSLFATQFVIKARKI